ncbi:MAG: acetylornithine deacetylase/succinyl-diaminopimelate desuccinylase-like protein, partial [Myxococcota bacterium]
PVIRSVYSDGLFRWSCCRVARPGQGGYPNGMQPPPIPFDTDPKTLNDGLERFKALLRIDTTNPPGNEVVAANAAVEWLAEAGIASRIHDAAPGRRSLVATYGPDDDDTLILSAHLDVVPADPTQWKYPPFDAVEAEGCIWGRGTIDMKHMAAYGLAIMRHLARHSVTLERGFKLVLVADEEAGCELGSLHLARNRPEWLRGGVAITEVGGFTTHVEGHRIYPIQVAEKGFVWLRLKVHGTPGHGSMPHNQGAVVKLAELVQTLATQPFPFRATQPVRDFLAAVAEVLGAPKGLVFKGIGTRSLSEFILERVVKDEGRARVFRSLLRDTVSPNMVVGGSKVNVIPSEAELVVDCRILPGTDPEVFAAEFKRRVPGDYDLEVIASGKPLVMDKNHPVVDAIFQVLREADPGCHPVPNMLSGFTDARAFEELGIPCYGFAPIWMPPELPFAPMFHGHNERIPVHGFRWGLATLLEFVMRHCGAAR